MAVAGLENEKGPVVQPGCMQVVLQPVLSGEIAKQFGWCSSFKRLSRLKDLCWLTK